jgi:hypothetical protein
MVKIVEINGTQLSNKPSVLEEITNDGFVFINEDGEEEILEFNTIREHFLQKTVKLKFEEISRNIVS